MRFDGAKIRCIQVGFRHLLHELLVEMFLFILSHLQNTDVRIRHVLVFSIIYDKISRTVEDFLYASDLVILVRLTKEDSGAFIDSDKQQRGLFF